MLTALFTGYSALVLWKDRRQKIYAEWHEEYQQNRMPIVYCEVKNGLNTTIVGDRVKVRGAVTEVNAAARPGDFRDKHPSWKSNEASIHTLTIEPGQSGRVVIRMAPDGDVLRQQAQGRNVRARMLLTKAMWRLRHWRYPSGPKLRISLTVRRRSSLMRPIRFTHTIRIYPEIAMKIADSIEKNADKT